MLRVGEQVEVISFAPRSGPALWEHGVVIESNVNGVRISVPYKSGGFTIRTIDAQDLDLYVRYPSAAGEKQIMNEKLLSSLTVTVIPKKPTRNSNFRKGDGPFVVKLSYYEGDGYVYRTLIDVPYNEMCLFLRHPVARTCVFKVGRWPFKRVQEVSYALNVRVRNTFGAASWINAHLSVSGLTEIPSEY